MSLSFIGGLLCFCVVFWVVIPAVYRRYAILAASIFVLYLLQPVSDASGIGFVLPTLMIVMVVGVGWLLQPSDRQSPIWLGGFFIGTVLLVLLVPQRDALFALFSDIVKNGIVAHSPTIITGVGLVGLSALTLRPITRKHILIGIAILIVLIVVRPFSMPGTLNSGATFSMPSNQVMVLAGVTLLSIAPWVIPRQRTLEQRRTIAVVWLVLMLVTFFVLKIHGLNRAVGTQLGTTVDLQWLGISYVVFRLVHVLNDFRNSTLDVDFRLLDFISYVLFFPTLVAGPITRIENIVPQLTAPQHFRVTYLVYGGMRLITGVFKKFVLAELLAVVMLQPSMVTATTSMPMLWGMLYAFLFHLYLDFSGYSDIAIGIGQLFGVMLPENFNRPFTQPNLSLFWQSWHITLSTWFRQYWFNPLTRRMMKSPLKRNQNLIILTSQLSTMVLIGLWHSASLNWIVWGLWHGLGLFFYRILGERTRSRFNLIASNRTLGPLLHTLNILLTFHFVLLSMVFIAFPNVQQGARVLLSLFGIR